VHLTTLCRHLPCLKILVPSALLFFRNRCLKIAITEKSRIGWFKYPTFQQWNPSPSSEYWHFTCNCITDQLVKIVAICETLVCLEHLKRLSVRHNFFQFTPCKGFNACTLCEVLVSSMLHTCPSQHSHGI
jgi:hypothetical protein